MATVEIRTVCGTTIRKTGLLPKKVKEVVTLFEHGLPFAIEEQGRTIHVNPMNIVTLTVDKGVEQ